MKTKTCKTCGKTKEATTANYYKDNAIKCGYRSCCKECSKKRDKKHYDNNTEAQNARCTKYKRANKEKVAKSKSAWKKNNARLNFLLRIFRILVSVSSNPN